MLDIYTDTTRQVAYFGGHLEIVEVEELASLRRGVTAEETEAKLAEFREAFDIQADCSPEELERAARTSVALDQLVAMKDLGSMAYYHMGSGNTEHEDVMSSVILGDSLLTANNVPVAGEYEVKNAQAMKIMDSFGVGRSFTEYYMMDFDDDVVLMGHDGPGHIMIASGNTNNRYSFPIGARAFVERWNEQGPAHHCAVGVGHLSNRLSNLGALLSMDVVRVC